MKPFQLIFQNARKYTASLVITGISMLALVGAQLIVPWIIRFLIQTISVPETGGGPFAGTGALALMALLIFLARAFLQFLRLYQSHIAGWGVVADVRKFIYNRLQRLSLRFYHDKQVGQLMANVINDTDLFEQLIAHALPDVIVNIGTFAGVTLVLFFLNWQLALLSMIPIPLVILSMKFYARYVRPAFRKRQKEWGELSAILNDNLSGIREIKAFTRESRESERVHLRIENYRKSLLKALRLMATFHPFVELSTSMGTLIVIFFGGNLALRGVLSVADLVAFFLYLDLFYSPVRNLSNAWESIQNAMAGADRITDLLHESEEPHNIPNAIIIKGRARGDISFRNVSFEYNPGVPVLEDITLDIPAHSIAALVGPSGVGKSTIAGLIPRFYDVTGGIITLDGRDLREYALDSLRGQISIVLQDVFLFYGSVRDNILFGRHGATDEEMVSAARAANAHEFIMQLPDAYDTLIGERGVRLSGGQKQRLSIARAVLKDAPILILDEATSAVDTETEILIQEAIENLIRGRTTIIIAHRLSTVRQADNIIVLEDKSVRETGTHEQLMNKNGLYHRLYSIQRLWETTDAE